VPEVACCSLSTYRTLQGVLGVRDEIAKAVVSFASHDSNFVNGIEIFCAALFYCPTPNCLYNVGTSDYMINLVILIGVLLGVPIAIAKFYEDVWLMDSQKKRLRERFETWWLTVADYDRLKLALACTVKFNSLLDKMFGDRLFSKEAFYECSIPSTGLLFACLAIVGLLNNEPFGVLPWKNYHESLHAMKNMANGLAPDGHDAGRMFESLDGGTNVDLWSHGYLYVEYHFARVSLNTNSEQLSPLETWSNSLAFYKDCVVEYDTPSRVVIYSVAFFIILPTLNACLCFCSLVFCRLILREIIASARWFSTFALLVTNLVLVLAVSSIVLILLTIIAVPIIWIVLPSAFVVAKQSFLTFGAAMLGSICGVWLMSSSALKIVLAIALLPSLLTIAVAGFSLIAMISRNALHSIVSAVLLRCAERSPFVLIGGSFGVIAALIACLAKLTRG